MLHLRRLVLAGSLLAGLLLPPGAGAADTPTDQARKLLALLAGVRTEYGEAYGEDGTLVRPIEIEEARLLLAEARDLAARLDALPGGALDAVEQDLGARQFVPDFAAKVTDLTRVVSERTGVHEDVLPPEPPSAARGAVLFAENCTTCHGPLGAGDGPEARKQDLHPADLTDVAFMRGETPRDFFNVITLGRRRAGMPEWGHAFSVQQRWDLVAHVWSLHGSPGDLAEGQGIWLTTCAGCHGTTGDGRGVLAAGLRSPVPDLVAAGRLAERRDADLFDATTHGVAGTAMPAFATLLRDDQRWDAIAFLRALSLGGAGGGGGGSRAAGGGAAGAGGRTGGATAAGDAGSPAEIARTAVSESSRLLDDALAARRRGDPEASSIATEAYGAFEPIEKRLGAVDSALVTHVEEGFVRVRSALRLPGTGVDAALEAEVKALHGHLDAALAALEPAVGPWALFAQSAAIILREGFEVVLIVGALLTYVRRTGQAPLVRSIWSGTGIGLLASLATAVLLTTVLRLTPWAGAALEGVAMLVAAVVLFWVSYWLVSKAQADRWQHYIQGKVKAAVAAGSTTALALAAFLAVYREGFETVLFYQALAASAPAGDLMVLAGFVAGSALLAVIHVALSRLEVKIPIATYFAVTGALLYGLAVVFAGRGVFELQEAGVVPLTPLAWAPRVPVLGVFPTVESLAAQGLLLALLVWALVVTARRGRAARDADLVTQIAQLRTMVADLRGELDALRGGVAPGAPGAGRADEAGRSVVAAGSRRG